MKIYVDKHELITIEHEGKFAIVDVENDFPKGDLEYAWVAPYEYVPDKDNEGDVLVYESLDPITLPLKYNDTVIGEAEYDAKTGEVFATITDERAIEYLGLNHPTNGVSVSL
jgi:hypothetical protein